MKVKKIKRIKQSPKLPAETRCEQLLKVSHELFDKKGYRATTLDEIGRGAGLTKGAVYHHFKNKEAIVLKLVRLILNVYKDGVREIPVGSLSPGDLISHLKKVDESIPRHHVKHNVSLLAEVIQIPKFRQAIDKGYTEFIELCCRCLDPSLAKSKKELHQLTIMIVNFFDGLCWASFMYPKHIEFDKQASLFSSLFDEDKQGKVKKQRGK